MDQPIFKVNNLIYKNKKETLLNIKNFEFHRGACYMINGNMGSGKTLMLDILTKQNNKYKASIEYEGNDINKISYGKYFKEVAYVKQIENKPFFKNVFG